MRPLSIPAKGVSERARCKAVEGEDEGSLLGVNDRVRIPKTTPHVARYHIPTFTMIAFGVYNRLQ